MKFYKTRFWQLGAMCALLAMGGCELGSKAGRFERPRDPWVFRSVLDTLPRMVTVALNEALWVSYSAQSGTLYKAWRGSVNFEGAVYNSAHGPQPTTVGETWYENAIAQPWVLTAAADGKALAYTVSYKGHRFEDEQVWLNVELRLASGAVIGISERPEYVGTKEGLAGLERTFRTADVPAGVVLAYRLNVSSIASTGSIQTTAPYKVLSQKKVQAGNLTSLEATLEVSLTANGETQLTTTFVREPTVANRFDDQATATAEIPLGAKLIERSDCKACHNEQVQTVGPAYVAIAERYANTEDNAEMLVSKIAKGGSGNWGEAAMSAHGDLPENDIREMVRYIMNLDQATETSTNVAFEEVRLEDYKKVDYVETSDLLPGAAARIFVFNKDLNALADINTAAKPTYGGVLPFIHLEPADFRQLMDNFAIEATGFIKVDTAATYVLRLVSDDGSRLQLGLGLEHIINNDGLHGSEPKDAVVGLAAGYHPFRMLYFQGRGGKFASLQWRKLTDKKFVPIPQSALAHLPSQSEALAGLTMPIQKITMVPGDGSPLTAVHPSYDLSQARTDAFLPKVGGMDFLDDGRLVVCTWDEIGGVYLLDNVESGDPQKITVQRIAAGLAEPLGLRVVDNEIYVLQKQELTRLVDLDGDDVIDDYQTVSNQWGVSTNFHEFSFGLAYKDNHFYAALATAIQPGGAGATNQVKDRGSAIRIARADGKVTFLAKGLRTPNGVGLGVDNEIFIADNQGDWLPSSKIVHVRQGAWFGSRAVDFDGTANLTETPPVVWLPQDEIGNSPSTPLALNDGIYKGQMIHGEVTHGGVKRVFVEKINGAYQGCVFRFIQGLEAGVNRMTWGPDGALYVGGIGNPGNWGQEGKLWYGLQRLKFNGKTTFEMLAVRAKTNGIEIELTEALPEGEGWNPSDYTVRQWRYQPTANYGGPKLDNQPLNILSVNVSDDRRRVFLELAGMKPQHVVYLRLAPFVSASGNEMWSTEAWYTLNQIPANALGFVRRVNESFAPNSLTQAEKTKGWQLLFDGKTTNGWHTFGKTTVGSSWKVVGDALTLDLGKKPDGSWLPKDGGDLTTNAEFENFELRLEWKIATCGNSGIMHHVVESKDLNYPWLTGPEMQILDNSCHPDSKYEKHRAGDLYDMMACKYPTARPTGEWNNVRIISNKGKMEYWLNGRKVVTFEMFTPEWEAMVAKSKFAEMPQFGKARKGRIVLQDHGDRVAFRNIKVLPIR